MNPSFSSSSVRHYFQSLHIWCLDTLISIKKMLHVYPSMYLQPTIGKLSCLVLGFFHSSVHKIRVGVTFNFPSMDSSGVTWMCTRFLESRMTASTGYDSSTYSSSILHQSKKIVCRMCFVFVFTSVTEISGPYEALCPLPNLLGPNTHLLSLLLHRENPVWYLHHSFIL